MTHTSYRTLLTLTVLALGLAGCETSPPADHSIKLMSSFDGKRMIAIPPECPSWHDTALHPWENTAMPQTGCASARNLAAQIERPEDLLSPHEMGPADAVVTAASVKDYRAGETKQLIDPNADAPAASSSTGSGATP